MLSQALMQQILQDIARITGAQMHLRTRQAPEGPDAFHPEAESAAGAEMSEAGVYRFPLADSGSPETVLECSGPHAEMAGQLFLREIAQLERLTKPRRDKTSFLQELFTGRVSQESLASSARKLHLDYNAARTVLLAEVPEEDLDLALQIASAIFSKAAGNQLFSISTGRFAVVHELTAAEAGYDLAHMLADTLRSEILTPVRVACGAPASHLGELARAYGEASTALSIATLFTPDSYVISYEKLGLGRLIYSLDPALCRSFLTETFGENNPLNDLDADTLTLINHFFTHNLNITDTAKELFLHRNTLIYRLEKIRDLTGFDLRRFDDAMTFRIALLVHRKLQEIR